MKYKQKLVDSIIESIKNNPADWRRNEYIAINDRAGIEIWIASGMDFLRIRIGGTKVIGGELIFLGNIIPWRIKLYHTINKYLKKQEKVKDQYKELIISTSKKLDEKR